MLRSVSPAGKVEPGAQGTGSPACCRTCGIHRHHRRVRRPYPGTGASAANPRPASGRNPVEVSGRVAAGPASGPAVPVALPGCPPGDEPGRRMPAKALSGPVQAPWVRADRALRQAGLPAAAVLSWPRAGPAAVRAGRASPQVGRLLSGGGLTVS